MLIRSARQQTGDRCSTWRRGVAESVSKTAKPVLPKASSRFHNVKGKLKEVLVRLMAVFCTLYQAERGAPPLLRNGWLEMLSALNLVLLSGTSLTIPSSNQYKYTSDALTKYPKSQLLSRPSTPFSLRTNMKLRIILSALAAGASLVVAAPTELHPRAPGDRGSYTVSGLRSRKQAVISKGGNSLDLAIAMLETDNMGTNYAYGE